ncbi:MAG TPA: hypothetical protein V6C65_09270 [Allocoleopsis sp.]
MADDITVKNASGGTETVALDEVGGKKYQVIKPAFGIDGAATFVSSSDPLPTTISGVSTLAEQQTQTTHLNAIETATEAIQSGLGDLATAANQTTIIGYVDGIEGLLATIDADTGNIATDIDTVASTVATVGTTPLVRMGIFDDLDNQITSFGGGTQYAEGDIAATITGTAIVFEQDSGTSTLQTVSQDYPLPVALANISGNYLGTTSEALHTHLIDGTGTTVMDNTNHAVNVNIVAGGNGGYTEGDIDASISGDAVMWEDASNTLRPTGLDYPLPVQILSSAGSEPVIDILVSSSIGHGVKTVTTAGTDVALDSHVCRKVTIQSQTDNTGLIAVGGSGVDATVATGTGVVLYPGDSIEIEIENTNLIYIDSTVSGEGVRYTYYL